MKMFTSLRLPNRAGNTGLVRLGLVILAGLTISAGRAAIFNDNFTNTIPIPPPATGSMVGTTVGATTQAGEQFTNLISASLWYRFTALSNLTAEFDLKGSTNYPYPKAVYVLIYTNNGATLNITNLTYVTNGWAQGASYQKATFQALSNHIYYLEVGTTTNAATNFVLNWSLSAPLVPPVNDNFANASPLVINNLWGTTNGDNTLATVEAREPSHAGFVPFHTVWYTWVAPQDGPVQFDTIGTSTTNDTVLAVYTGTSLATLNQVAANDDLYPYLQENYTAQNIYYIGVSRNSTNYYDTTNLPVASLATGGIIISLMAVPALFISMPSRARRITSRWAASPPHITTRDWGRVRWPPGRDRSRSIGLISRPASFVSPPRILIRPG